MPASGAGGSGGSCRETRLPELKGRKWGTQNKVCSYGPGWHLRLLLQAPLTLRSVGCLWLPPAHLQCSP